jgi:acyl-CoA thioesterase 11
MVNRTFGSSMEVGVRVEAEDMATGARRHCCSAYLSFVSLTAKTQQKVQKQQQQASDDVEHQQQLLPRVVPNTSEQTRIYAQAEARRAQRLAARQAAQHDPHRAAVLAACRLRPITHRCVFVVVAMAGHGAERSSALCAHAF